MLLEAMMRGSGNVVVRRELLERVMHAVEDAEYFDHRELAKEIRELLDNWDTELGIK